MSQPSASETALAAHLVPVHQPPTSSRWPSPTLDVCENSEPETMKNIVNGMQTNEPELENPKVADY